ncbi:MAG: response regulator transcription factor [Chloroflexota bacterium]|nr:response regulator transcription factor [Chloroflexota bacterium]
MASILLVDDAQELALVVARELEAAGYAVTQAATGPAALEAHARAHPDLVILDWMLPGLDGLAVLRRMRETTATPVLMLTARSEEADRVLGLEVGADDYLTKPFSMRELLARVRALLRRVELIRQTVSADREPGEAPLRYGALLLDPVARRITLDGAPVEVSATEFALLRLLMRSPGRAFSRAYLLETVWAEDYIGGDRSVDNAILRLRKKIEPLGEAVETVWGVGYRLRAEGV